MSILAMKRENHKENKSFRRFFETMKENAASRREPESDLDFYTHSALSTVLAMQESFKQEQR